MTQEFILANARIVLAERVVPGWIRVSNGLIAEIGEGSDCPAGAVDCSGAYLAPGLVELHTDNLERHITPRPKVDWPHKPAIIAHDAELASTGITTVFDALRVGSIPGAKSEYKRYARPLADEILQLRAAGALKISHHLHLRAEICSETLIEEFAEFGPDDRVGIVSLMDHMPGQRQFSDMDKYSAYVMRKYDMTLSDLEEHVAHLFDIHERLGARHEATAVSEAARLGATLASHDDMTQEQVAVSAGHNVVMAEFPTTLSAAQACKDAGISVIMGAPNVVRGGSHSGNVSALDLARDGLLDILSSDYVPSALLLAACRLATLWDDLPRGIGTVTRAPAMAAGLHDRGAIGVGLRADLIRFDWQPDEDPVISAVWCHGRQVA